MTKFQKSLKNDYRFLYILTKRYIKFNVMYLVLLVLRNQIFQKACLKSVWIYIVAGIYRRLFVNSTKYIAC